MKFITRIIFITSLILVAISCKTDDEAANKRPSTITIDKSIFPVNLKAVLITNQSNEVLYYEILSDSLLEADLDIHFTRFPQDTATLTLISEHELATGSKFFLNRTYTNLDRNASLTRDLSYTESVPVGKVVNITIDGVEHVDSLKVLSPYQILDDMDVINGKLFFQSYASQVGS